MLGFEHVVGRGRLLTEAGVPFQRSISMGIRFLAKGTGESLCALVLGMNGADRRVTERE